MENFDIEKIEQYLGGQLDSSEQELLSDRIKQEPEFAKEVAFHQLTMEGIEQFGINQTIQNLDGNLAKEGFFLTTEDIDDYLEGKANTEEQSAMENRLAEDSDFKEDFHLHQLTTEGIERGAATSEFSDLFNKIDSDLEREGFFDPITTGTQPDQSKAEAKIVRFPFRGLAVAASVTLAVFSTWWYFQAPSTETIYASHFSPLDDQLSAELSEMGFIQRPYYDILEDGIKAYNDARNSTDNNTTNERYNTAKGLLTQYLNAAPATDEFYPTAKLYLAISHLELEDFNEAISLLTPITEQDFPQKVDAQWYLALSYLKTNQQEKAIPLLTALDQSTYAKQAQDILKNIQ